MSGLRNIFQLLLACSGLATLALSLVDPGLARGRSGDFGTEAPGTHHVRLVAPTFVNLSRR